MAKRSGIGRERALVKEAWEKGFFAIRSAGSGSGTSAYPKPDLIVFRPGGVIDVIQVKTTVKKEIRFGPDTWRDEVLTARRLRSLGFRTRVWLSLRIKRPGRSRDVLLRVDGHEEDHLYVRYDPKRDRLTYSWRGDNHKRGGGSPGEA